MNVNKKIIFMLILVSLLTSCQSQDKKDIFLNETNSQVMQIDVFSLTTGEAVLIDSFSDEENQNEIKKFVKAFNSAKRMEEDYGTTPLGMIVVTLKNGEEVKVWGLAENFNTVQINGEQYNIKGKEIYNYFEQYREKIINN